MNNIYGIKKPSMIELFQDGQAIRETLTAISHTEWPTSLQSSEKDAHTQVLIIQYPAKIKQLVQLAEELNHESILFAMPGDREKWQSWITRKIEQMENKPWREISEETQQGKLKRYKSHLKTYLALYEAVSTNQTSLVMQRMQLLQSQHGKLKALYESCLEALELSQTGEVDFYKNGQD